MKTDKTLSELIEIIPDAALVVDLSGVVVLLNSLLARMFGYDKAELLGRPLDHLMPEETRAQHSLHVKHFFANGDSRPMGRGLRLLGVRKSGETFPVEIMLSLIHLDDKAYAMAFVRDATQFKLTEEKIRRELEQERTMALTDHLTGLGNRRAFTQELEQDIDELRQFGWQLSYCQIWCTGSGGVPV